ncbi:hypothetical protein HELRODRAFT_137277, partial [Helobdella robusta]|uniref:C2H2-type domain-containing protein n=1 Tax=Helobdella robusta TaxID=6412 RepID=T1EII8_HELRO
MTDDKPFECTNPGCGMKFTNEDHLAVHKAKHQLSLTIDDIRPGLLSFVADQTPTPSKFLKNCEDVGLFQDFGKNPFEEAFKRATE